MDLFNTIIWWINIAVICIVGSVFLFQILFMFTFFLRPRKYKKGNEYHDFTFIIRAHNEEDVIADSVDSALKCDYPAEKKHVVVFCHNCTDKTAEIALAHGARIIELVDHDPKHQKASYCMKLGMDKLKEDKEHTYEYFLFLDADNQVDKNYLNACNDAVCDGVELGRTYENSKNLTDNTISCMTGLWYARDNFFACRSRSALHLGVVMNGCCSMVKAEYALNWDAMSASDDIEFTLNRLLKDDRKVEYIEDAILYEDQPTTISDMVKRNTRMGNGLNKLFWTTGIKCLGKFFKTLFNFKIPFSLKMTYLDQYCNIATIPAALLAVVWFVPYYVYTLIYTGLGNIITIEGLGQYNFRWFLLFVIIVALSCYLLPFFFQPILSTIKERKKLIISKKSVVVKSIVLFPLYMLIQLAAIVMGIFSKPKWKKLKRSKTKVQS